MPRSYASRRSATADSSECSPHQPVDTVHRPNPTSEAGMPDVPKVRVFTPLILERLSAAGVAAQAVEPLEPAGDRRLRGALEPCERVLEAEPLRLVAAQCVIGED